MMRVQQNPNSGTEPNFGKIYGAKSAIKSLKSKRYFDFAKELKEILPKAKEASEGVDMFIKDTDDGLEIRVGEEIKKGHPLFESFLAYCRDSGTTKDEYMLKRFYMGGCEYIRDFGSLRYSYNSPKPNEFGAKVLEYVNGYKETFLECHAEWLKNKK